MAQPLMGSFQLMKSLNRSLILNTIRKEGPISRAEIAKQTKLTPPTVSNLVKELIETNMVIESTQGESRGGRKPTMLIINSKGSYIIGADVGPDSIYAVISDLNADILVETELKIPVPITNEGFLSLLTETIINLLGKDPSIKEERLIGMGVAMHGIVDVPNGVSLYAPNLQLRDIPIKAHLEDVFKMTVRVENDARAMALGESWFGHGSKIEDCVCVNVGSGIGAGFIINGQLYHGNGYLSGEIGHMTIDIDGPKCSCGNYGCLQALASGPSIAEQMKKALAMGQKSVLSERYLGKFDQITSETIYKAALEGDALSVHILHQAGVYLGIGLTNVVHLINPKRIIIGGGVSKAGAYVIDSIKDTIQQRGLTQKAKETEIVKAKLGDQATVIGAVSLLLVELFSTANQTGA